jgi:AAA15 family ATPase/GTPase
VIDAIFIKNYKIFERETIRLDSHNIIIGENDSGKSSILEALDIFFNHEKISNTNLVRDIDNDVEIGVLIGQDFYKKIYTGKTKKVTYNADDFSDFPDIQYIYIDSNTQDIVKIINDLSTAKSIEILDDATIETIEDKMRIASQQVLDSIDPDMIVINQETTNFDIEPQIKIDSALKFKISSSGIPIEGRGSGFKKNVLYSLLTKNTYNNVILGIDEIENSLSIRNSKDLIELITTRFPQTLITTHSPKILEVSKRHNIIPRFSTNISTITQLLNLLDSTQETVYILIEGKFDIPWIRRVLNLTEIEGLGDYVLLPSGGSSNIDVLANELSINGRRVIKIFDGDTNNDDYKLSKDIIEMYAPLDELNSIFSVELETYPLNKQDFFDSLITDFRNEDSIKNELSQRCETFITEDCELSIEVKNLVETQLRIPEGTNDETEI